MMSEERLQTLQTALADLPDTASDSEPALENVYLPASHLKAMDPDCSLIIGMRGAGKTFWWHALQHPAVRGLVSRAASRPYASLDAKTEVRRGFGVSPAPDDYPGRDVFRSLMDSGHEPRLIWRTVQAWHVSDEDHPLRRRTDWASRVAYVGAHPEQTDRLFRERDDALDREGVHLLILFDALDRTSDDWRETSRIIRGLVQTALELRGYRRLRVKAFLRTDQFNESEIGDFPDASKVLSSRVELSWPRHHLYGLLWHLLANGQRGDFCREFLGVDWIRATIEGKRLYGIPRKLVEEDRQREKFREIAGPWMGRGPRRGLPYTWIPNHLGDGQGHVSPRSFLTALRTAAEDTTERYPDSSRYALHFESIKRGVQAASRIRVREVQEDYPWVRELLEPLAGRVVPCRFEDIEKCWNNQGVVLRLRSGVAGHEVKLPPQNLEEGTRGLRRDLEHLGIFYRMHDGRVNVPDVFRVGYGLGRRGGVKPVS